MSISLAQKGIFELFALRQNKKNILLVDSHHSLYDFPAKERGSLKNWSQDH
jgi:hypothetical protein